ncbi:MAG: glycosyltransferase [Acidimicrobiales bacterium]
MISVVVPVLNAAGTIGEQLAALAGQEADVAWEVVVADNGSTDATRSALDAAGPKLPHLRVVDALRRRGPAAARNQGAAAARGDVLAFCDADDVVAPGWLAAVATATGEHDFVAGSLDIGGRWRPPAPPDSDPPPLWAPTTGTFGWLKYGLGANMAVSRRAFDQLGGFAEELQAGEDLDLSWRLQLAGYPLHYEPAALVYKRPRPTSAHQVRQYIKYGRYNVMIYKRLRSAGMPRRPLDAQLRHYGWLGLNAWRLVAGGRGRVTWLISASAGAGRILGSIRYRTLYL